MLWSTSSSTFSERRLGFSGLGSAAAAARVLALLGALGLDLGLALGGPLDLGRLDLGLGLGLLLVRTEDHDHVAAVLLGRRLDEAELLDVVGEPLEQAQPQLGAVLLTTTEHDRDLHLVALLQEPHDVTLLGLVVVRVDLRAELHLLDDHVGLVPARLTGLLGVLVLELPVVHELADRRSRHGGDLDEVEVGLLREPEGVLDADDADGLAVGADEPDLGYPDPVVDAQLGADGSSCGCPVWRPTRRRTLKNETGFRVRDSGSQPNAVRRRAGRSPPHCRRTALPRTVAREPCPRDRNPTTWFGRCGWETRSACQTCKQLARRRDGRLTAGRSRTG